MRRTDFILRMLLTIALVAVPLSRPAIWISGFAKQRGGLDGDGGGHDSSGSPP